MSRDDVVVPRELAGARLRRDRERIARATDRRLGIGRELAAGRELQLQLHRRHRRQQAGLVLETGKRFLLTVKRHRVLHVVGAATGAVAFVAATGARREGGEDCSRIEVDGPHARTNCSGDARRYHL